MAFADLEYNDENYFLSHWRGKQSLAKSYWLNGVLMTVIAGIAAQATVGWAEGGSLSLTSSAIVLISMNAVLLGIAVWAWVGIWRAAKNHKANGGSSGWAALAQASVCLGILGWLAQASALAEWSVETAQLAVGQDSLGDMANIRVQSDELIVEGYLTNGVADHFGNVLKSAPHVRRVRLNSPGGRSYEAEKIGQIVRSNELDVAVEGECSSACTLILLSGERRSLEAGGRIGFHRPFYDGLDQPALDAMADELADSYRKLGLRGPFIRDALRASHEEMWYPDEETLFAEGVLNRFSSRRIAANNALIASDVNRRSPLRLDEVTVLTGASARENTLTYSYKVEIERDELAPNFAEVMKPGLAADACAEPLSREYFESGAVFQYSYVDASQQGIAVIEVDGC